MKQRSKSDFLNVLWTSIRDKKERQKEMSAVLKKAGLPIDRNSVGAASALEAALAKPTANPMELQIVCEAAWEQYRLNNALNKNNFLVRLDAAVNQLKATRKIDDYTKIVNALEAVHLPTKGVFLRLLPRLASKNSTFLDQIAVVDMLWELYKHPELND